MTDETINREIHEKLFGGDCWHDYEYMGINKRWRKCRVCGLEDANCAHSNPDYCNSIADAFKIVEKMRGKELYLSLATLNHSACFSNATKDGFFQLPDDWSLWKTANSDAMAICLAALEIFGTKTLRAKSRPSDFELVHETQKTRGFWKVFKYYYPRR